MVVCHLEIADMTCLLGTKATWQQHELVDNGSCRRTVAQNQVSKRLPNGTKK